MNGSLRICSSVDFVEGHGHPRVIFLSNYDGLESQMLHTKFHENRPAGSGEEDF